MLYNANFALNQLSNDELKDMLNQELHRYAQTASDLNASENRLRQLGHRLASSVAYKKGLRFGGRVIVQWSDGDEVCIYEGVTWNQYELKTMVSLRPFTKKGHPFKRPVEYEAKTLAFMIPAKQAPN